MTTSALGLPEILTTANDVRICGTTIERPPAIAPSQWLAFWNAATYEGERLPKRPAWVAIIQPDGRYEIARMD